MASVNDAAVPKFTGQTPLNVLDGKLVAGYQMWFNATEDDLGWVHWTKQGKRAAEDVMKIEIWPDVREYPEGTLYPTGFDSLGDGSPARLFRSKNEDVVDLHFKWMSEYGIDGVGVQRFYGSTSQTEVPGENHLNMVKRAAEKYGKVYYVMYDMSGSGNAGDAVIDRMKGDWVYNIEQKGIVSSPNYLYKDGKPVVCIWGLAEAPKEPKRYTNAEVALTLVKWFKNRGYYVIGGLPDNDWFDSVTDYAEVYRSIDMASPWTIGRFHTISAALAWWKDKLPKELLFCKNHGMDYMPVVFPGFAWSNMYIGRKANEIPRGTGSFLWEQVSYLRENGIDTMYAAMFDEYDEGTSFIKGAEDSFGIPAGRQYFLTYAADGTWLSSDYYLRLAGVVGGLLRGEVKPGRMPRVAHSMGPVYWRNSFEKRTASDGLLMDIDVGLLNGEAEANNVTNVSFEITDADANTGAYSALLKGAAKEGGASYRSLIGRTEILVPDGLELTFFIKAINPIGANVRLDLKFGDGTFLSDSKIKWNLLSGTPAKGNPNAWTKKVGCDLSAFAGKTVTGVYALLETSEAGEFGAYIDDIRIGLGN